MKKKQKKQQHHVLRALVELHTESWALLQTAGRNVLQGISSSTKQQQSSRVAKHEQPHVLETLAQVAALILVLETIIRALEALESRFVVHLDVLEGRVMARLGDLEDRLMARLEGREVSGTESPLQQPHRIINGVSSSALAGVPPPGAADTLQDVATTTLAASPASSSGNDGAAGDDRNIIDDHGDAQGVAGDVEEHIEKHIRHEARAGFNEAAQQLDRLLRQLMQTLAGDAAIIDKVARVQVPMQRPSAATRIAQAYDLMREVRKAQGTDAELTQVMILMREFLVLLILSTAPCLMTGGVFANSLERYFDRGLFNEKEAQLRSQLYKARERIGQLGRNRELFEGDAKENIFKKTMNADQMQNLFALYVVCSSASYVDDVDVIHPRRKPKNIKQPATAKTETEPELKPQQLEPQQLQPHQPESHSYSSAATLQQQILWSLHESAALLQDAVEYNRNWALQVQQADVENYY